MSRFASFAVLALALSLATGGPTPLAEGADRTEVVVLLDSPPLARVPGGAFRDRT